MQQKCNNCGEYLLSDATLCTSCNSPVNQSDDSSSLASRKMDVMIKNYQQKQQGKIYTRPENYQFSNSPFTRINRILRADIHIIKEINDRQELQKESLKILSITIFYIIFINSISALSKSSISPIETILTTAGFRLLFNLTFLFLLVYFGKTLTGKGILAQKQDVMRVLNYTFVIIAIHDSITIVSTQTGLFIFKIIFYLSLIYFIFLLSRVLTRLLDLHFVVSIFSTLLSYILSLAFASIIMKLITDIIF